MADEAARPQDSGRVRPRSVWRRALLRTLLAVAGVGLAFAAWKYLAHPEEKPAVAQATQSGERRNNAFYPTAAQWATLTVETVEQRVFRAEHATEGKITVDEDRATPIFSPYAGRVTKLLAKPGETIKRGQALFVVEATDMVQAQNDFLTALAARNKARSQLNLTQIVEKRQRELFESKATALKDWQQAQAELSGAQNDLRSTEAAIEAIRNRLRILGKTNEEIATLEQTGRISSETPIYSPLGGTVVQRKVGPGQYVSSGSNEPVFVIGDLSTVWIIAFVRETEAAKLQIGQQIDFTVLAYPNEVFKANINYVAATLDPTSRRLMARATVPNSGRLLKPEMFASVRIFTDEGDAWPAVPRNAVIYEGDAARVWTVKDDKGIELRRIKLGVNTGDRVQVLQGLAPGDRVITKGSLFIDRVATGS